MTSIRPEAVSDGMVVEMAVSVVVVGGSVDVVVGSSVVVVGGSVVVTVGGSVVVGTSAVVLGVGVVVALVSAVVGRVPDADSTVVVGPVVETFVSEAGTVSAAIDAGWESPDRSQAHPPAAPAPINTPSIARKSRRLGRATLTTKTVAVSFLNRSIPFICVAVWDFRPWAPVEWHSRLDRIVFVYYFSQLIQPFERVESRVSRLLGDLTVWADAAYRDGEELRARVGVGGKRPFIAKTVTLHVGRPVRMPNQTTIPLSWKATGAPGLFPQMNADLTVARIGPELTQLAFRGSYEAPGGSIGQAIDEALLHRIAESSVKGFVDRIGDEIGNGSDLD